MFYANTHYGRSLLSPFSLLLCSAQSVCEAQIFSHSNKIFLYFKTDVKCFLAPTKETVIKSEECKLLGGSLSARKYLGILN